MSKTYRNVGVDESTHRKLLIVASMDHRTLLGEVGWLVDCRYDELMAGDDDDVRQGGAGVLHEPLASAPPPATDEP